MAQCLTLDEISEKTGINRATISNYENGKTFPNQENLEIIADFFDVTIDYLLKYNRKCRFCCNPSGYGDLRVDGNIELRCNGKNHTLDIWDGDLQAGEVSISNCPFCGRKL